MKNPVIELYSPEMAHDWDAFVDASRNATFLFSRGYMDYHSDRFSDHSLIIRDDGKIVALLPANIIIEAGGEKILCSHSGLTYGGWLVGQRHPDGDEMLRIFGLLKDYCLQSGIGVLDYKPIPFIYPAMPAQEDLYALFRIGAVVTERNLSAAICLDSDPGFNTQQKRNLKRGLASDARMSEVFDDAGVERFHALLTRCLKERHDASPVHSCGELQLLKSRFPDEIRIFMVEAGDKPEAGVCIFDCGNAVHAQYICSSESGRRKGLLTLLFHRLIHDGCFPSARYFDFGTSNEARGLILNEGLYRQKSALGGSGVAYDRYRVVFSD